MPHIMYRRAAIVILSLLCGVCDVSGYAEYKSRIPNGDRIPHPCKPNYYWHGVGHINSLGGGNRNQFGQHFAAARKQWTSELCAQDSDDDGQTNGQELGDPDCVWSEDSNSLPPRITNITHPGVCTPWDSPQCEGKNDWVSCDTGEFVCDPINETGVETLTLRFPPTPVPAKETTYICKVFDVPTHADFHLIGYKPFINNSNVMHHMTLYGCSDADDVRTDPFECGMTIGYGCTQSLGGWAVGSTGECFSEEFGMQFGNSSYRHVVLEFHWNNPHLRPDWEDSSGITMYYTSKLRPHNGAIMSVGDIGLAIPPGQSQTHVTSTCSAECLGRRLTGPINVTMAINHMHYLGRGQTVEHYRNGEFHGYLTNEDSYSYDRPRFFNYNPPITIDPGDHLVTTCTFNSQYESKWVHYGPQTSDEMCFGIIRFYPAENMREYTCLSWRSLPMCEPNNGIVHEGCDVLSFISGTNEEANAVFLDVAENCPDVTRCTEQCKAAIVRARTHPCLVGGDITDYVTLRLGGSPQGLVWLLRFRMCDKDMLDPCDNPNPSSAASTRGSFLLLVMVMSWRII